MRCGGDEKVLLFQKRAKMNSNGPNLQNRKLAASTRKENNLGEKTRVGDVPELRLLKNLSTSIISRCFLP